MKSDIVLPKGQLGWLYGIRLSHNDVGGFGKTRERSPRSRLVKGYINHSACLQSFHMLRFGLYQRLESVENFIKSQHRDKSLILIDKELEWFTLESAITNQDLVDIVDTRIKQMDFADEVFRIKKEYLPFTHRTNYTNLMRDPNVFLEKIT